MEAGTTIARLWPRIEVEDPTGTSIHAKNIAHAVLTLSQVARSAGKPVIVREMDSDQSTLAVLRVTTKGDTKTVEDTGQIGCIIRYLGWTLTTDEATLTVKSIASAEVLVQQMADQHQKPVTLVIDKLSNATAAEGHRSINPEMTMAEDPQEEESEQETEEALNPETADESPFVDDSSDDCSELPGDPDAVTLDATQELVDTPGEEQDEVLALTLQVGSPTGVEMPLQNTAAETHIDVEVDNSLVHGIEVVEPESRAKDHKRRKKVLLAAAGIVLVCGIGAGTIAMGTVGSRPSATSSTAVVSLKPSVKLIPLPFKTAPAGMDSEATWSMKIKPNLPPLVDPAGYVAFANTEGQLVLTGPGGNKLWATDISPDTTSLKLATVDGKLSVIALGAGVLQIFPVGNEAPTVVTIKLPAKATPSWAGGNVLITVSSDVAAYIKDGKLVETPTPAGSVAVAAGADGVLFADGTGKWWKLAGKTNIATGTLPTPNGLTGSPSLIRTYSYDYITAVWARANEQVVTLASLKEGTIVASATIPKQDLSTFSNIFRSGGTAQAFGSLVIQAGASPSIAYLEGIKVLQISSTTVYGKNESNLWVSASLTGEDVTTQPGGSSVAIPWGTTKDFAYVVDAVSASDWSVYALSLK